MIKHFVPSVALQRRTIERFQTTTDQLRHYNFRPANFTTNDALTNPHQASPITHHLFQPPSLKKMIPQHRRNTPQPLIQNPLPLPLSRDNRIIQHNPRLHPNKPLLTNSLPTRFLHLPKQRSIHKHPIPSRSHLISIITRNRHGNFPKRRRSLIDKRMQSQPFTVLALDVSAGD
jgi:hypothetical protein